MAHEAKLSSTVVAAVAGISVQEGRLVQLNASGVHNDLPIASFAASGTQRNVYVAFAAPDNFSRPTPATLYTAGNTGSFYENGAFGTSFSETDTFYYNGLSTQENPMLASGYVMLAKKGGVYIVPSGCIVTNTGLRVNGALAKVSDDGTGRFELTTNDAVAIARVRDWEPSLDLYTFETGLL